MIERAPCRLVVFDLDGTLVDSQATIVACAQAAFTAEGLPPPPPEAIRRIVGLSLAQAMRVLLGDDDPATAERIAERYRTAFVAFRALPEFDEPLFDGALEVIEALAARGVAMGIATGKAMRGLRHVLDHHGLERWFVTLQTADLHPSKPHPAMLEAAMREAGAVPAETLMIGDTSYDVLMARAAGARPIGVAWGNHPAEELRIAGAEVVLDRFAGLLEQLGPAR
jgi:phosphoglycolate phosphatase